MSYKDEILKYLLEPTNLEIALEIRDQMSEIPIILEKKFWEDVNEIMKAYLAEEKEGSPKTINWTVKFDALREMSENNFGVGFVPEKAQDSEKYLYMRLEKENLRLFFGVRIGGNFPQDGNYNDIEGFITKLREDLKNEGYKEEQNNWIAWKWLDNERLDYPQTLVRIARGDYQKNIATSCFDFFRHHKRDLDDINEKIKNI